MSFLYNNVAAIAVAAVASLMGWMFGGAIGEVLIPVAPWLLVIMIEVIVCYPQRHQGETTYEARSRVWHELRHSKVLLVSLVFMGLLLVPFVNNGLCPGCDAALIATGVDPNPSVSFLPFCLDRIDHLKVVSWFMIVLPSVIAVHHCLTRRGKRLVVKMIVWNGAVMAVLGFIQGAAGAPGPLWRAFAGTEFFSTFGYPNMAGDYFTLLFGLSVALWREKCERIVRGQQGKDFSEIAGRAGRYGRFWNNHYFLIPAALCFFAALNTLSRAAILLVSLTAVVYFVHTLLIVLSRMHRSRRVVVGVWSLVIFGLIVFFSAIFMPAKIRREVSSLENDSALDRVTGKAQYHCQVATSIWTDHLLFGCGGWGYAHLCGPKMKELGIDIGSMQIVGGTNVHNDHLQFLAEHGAVGFGCLLAIVVLLVWPVAVQWKDLAYAQRFKKDRYPPPRPAAVFALPAPAFIIMVAVLATFIHAFGDCPLRSCAVLDIFFIAIAALSGFMPKPKEGDLGLRHRHHHHR